MNLYDWRSIRIVSRWAQRIHHDVAYPPLFCPFHSLPLCSYRSTLFEVVLPILLDLGLHFSSLLYRCYSTLEKRIAVDIMVAVAEVSVIRGSSVDNVTSTCDRALHYQPNHSNPDNHTVYQWSIFPWIPWRCYTCLREIRTPKMNADGNVAAVNYKLLLVYFMLQVSVLKINITVEAGFYQRGHRIRMHPPLSASVDLKWWMSN